MKEFLPFSDPKSRQHHVQKSLSLIRLLSQFNEDRIQFPWNTPL